MELTLDSRAEPDLDRLNELLAPPEHRIADAKLGAGDVLELTLERTDGMRVTVALAVEWERRFGERSVQYRLGVDQAAVARSVLDLEALWAES